MRAARGLLAVAVLAAACAVVAAVATANTITGGSALLGSGVSTISTCETSTLTFPQRALDNTASHNVTSLKVSTIDPACSGATLTVTLESGTYSIWCPVPGHAAQGMKTSFSASGGSGVSATTTSATTTDSGGGGAAWG